MMKMYRSWRWHAGISIVGAGVLGFSMTIRGGPRDIRVPDAPGEGRTAQGVVPVDKKGLITPEARAESHRSQGRGPSCSGDASQLLFPLDGSYAPVNFCALPVTPGYDQAQCTGEPPDQHNDDDSSEIPLNFTFSLFGDPYTMLWVNNNGVLSFDSYFENFSSLVFPDPALPPLVAPMWQDVDTGQANTVQHGDVWFKQFDSDGSGSDDTLVVTWENVGYFDDNGDLLNTFQVAISDGTNPIMGLGTDLCFSYDNMCWTSGDITGDGGFLGTPATVGVNRGDGVDFFQAGRFDHEGADFDGPFGAADGVSYLDDRVICFAPCDGDEDCDDSNVCTDDACTLGVCEHAPVTAGTACGDPGDTECDNPDTCNGAGACQSNNVSGGTSCGDPGDTECDNPDTCDGAGNCDGNDEPNGTACGDPTDDDCKNPDTCDGAGTCDNNDEADETACGDPTDDDCKNPDTCLAAVCEDNDEEDGTQCTDDGDPGTDDVCEGAVCTHPPIPGACCVGATGVCTDPAILADCQEPLDEWTPYATCEEVPCPVNVPAGQDCYRVECAVTEFSFSDDPIPADFFCPPSNPSCGSDPFDGAIRMGGEGTGDPNYDLTIERLEDMVFGQVFPSEQTIDIQLVTLNLVNCDPIEVGMPGGQTALWNVAVGLSSITPPTGTLTAIKEHENGGVFMFTYFVQPTFTFSSVDDPGVIRTFDTGQRGIDPIEVDTLGLESWVHVADIEADPCGVAFFPGADEEGFGRRGATGCCKPIAGGKLWNCKTCNKGACMVDDTCTVTVRTSPTRSAEENCENPEGGGGLGGTYCSDGTNCKDSDQDGLLNVQENLTGACGGLCSDPKFSDTDSDGCSDGVEVAEATDPCKACSFPTAKPFCFPDCNSNNTPDQCDLDPDDDPTTPPDPKIDCGAPSVTDIPNETPNGIPDSCEDDGTNFWGACCSSNACFNGTTNECTAFSGGVFQGFCTRCPTNLPGNTHQGRSIVHFTTRPAECSITEAAGRGEDCDQRTMYFDSWRTDLGGGGEMCHKFGLDGEGLGTPEIPADFFGPGSEPFDGQICLAGVPLGFVSIDVPGGPLIEGEFGDADTIILRSDDPFDPCATTSGTRVPVDIKVIKLSLESTASFTVDFGAAASQQWNAEVSISDTPIADLPLGELTAIKTHCNGGTYNSVLNVLPKFTFTNADDPNVTVNLDFGTETDFGSVELTQDTNPQWVHEKEGDIALADDPCTEFRPGIEAVSIDTICDCNGNGQRDSCDVESGAIGDCNANGVPDDCDVDSNDPDGNGLVSVDCNDNGIPDECEDDCNANGIADSCDVRDCPPEEASCQDVNSNGTPDGCEPDCQPNDVPDGWDLSIGTAEDCQPNGRPDECDVTSGIDADCNANSVPDSCDITNGTSPDADGDGVPDECTPGCAPLELPANPTHHALKHRYLSVNPSTSLFNNLAIRVEIVELMRCDNDLERACTVDGDCVDPGPGMCIQHPDVGSSWWVQAPQQEPLGCLPGPCGDEDWFARVDGVPHFGAWTLSTLHISDCEIIPVAVYELRVCLPPDGTVCCDPLTIRTIRQPFIAPESRGNYGDVAGQVEGTDPDFYFTPPDGFTNIIDVSAYILTKQNYGTGNKPQTHPTWVDLHGLGAGNPPQYILNVSDLGQILKAFVGDAWTDDPGNMNPGQCP